MVGEIAEFMCFSSGYVNWYKETGLFIPYPRPNTLFKGRAFVIKHVKLSDKGFYHCHGINDQNEEFHGRVQLIVEGKLLVGQCHSFLISWHV